MNFVQKILWGFEVKGRKSWGRANILSHLLITANKSKDNGKTIKKVSNSAQSNVSVVPLYVGHAFKTFSGDLSR